MNNIVLANVVVAVHATLIFSVLVGILISVRYKRFRPLETFALIAFILIWSLYGACPLTNLEDYLRGGPPSATSLTNTGFIPYYLRDLFGIELPRRFVVNSIYATGAIFFLISIEWLSPYINIEIGKARKFFRRKERKESGPRGRRRKR